MTKANGKEETLAIPESLRMEVFDRDQGVCRFCGQADEQLAIHHARFGGDLVGTGGRRQHYLENLISVGWLFKHDCHSIIHARKLHWMPYVLEAIVTPGVTVLQLERWARRRTVSRYAPWTFAEAEQAFWRRVREDDGCLIYEGSDAATYNYGQFRAMVLEQERGKPGVPLKAHHVAWRFVTGAWPTNALLHTCDRPGCVRPEHLYEGDQAQNMEDRKSRRPRHGAANPAARHADKVDEIRRRFAAGEKQWMIVRATGVPQATVSRIIRGVSYPDE